MRFVRDNGLTLAFAALFALSLVGNALAMLALRIEEPHGDVARGVLATLSSAEFLKGVFGNWQAAFLQLLALILLATFLRQRGASHSREPLDEAAREASERSTRPRPLRQALGQFPGLYAHSLSLAFAILFVASFAAFFVVDRISANQHRLQEGQPAFGALAFLRSARFWFDVLQTWQAEFFVMAVFLVASIFLREVNSPESKAVDADNRETADVNE